MTAPDGAGRLLDVLVAPFRAYCVYAAVQLDLPDRLATGAVETSTLAEELDVDPDALRRLLRMLASLRVADPVRSDAYGIGELGELLRADVPNSMQALATCYAEQFYLPFRHIASCIRDGRQGFADVFGAPLFEHYANNPHDGRIFDAAMAAGSSFFRAVPQVHDFSDATRVVDVGGGDGSLLADILATNPHLHGVLAEMPRLADTARVRLHERGLIERCVIAGCDLFQEVPDGADVYILSRILHDWDDYNCQQILRVIRAAMRSDARLLVIERVVPSEAHTVIRVRLRPARARQHRRQGTGPSRIRRPVRRQRPAMDTHRRTPPRLPRHHNHPGRCRPQTRRSPPSRRRRLSEQLIRMTIPRFRPHRGPSYERCFRRVGQ